MKLYIVYNGYMGYGAVKCYVIAENEERAIEMARNKYKTKSEYYGNRFGYGERYYAHLKAECLCDDTSKEFVSEITDG